LFFFAHRDFAAFLAISRRRLAEIVFIRAFADFRPIAEKYSDSLRSISFFDSIIGIVSAISGR
jgi:hypothetical protein